MSESADMTLGQALEAWRERRDGRFVTKWLQRMITSGGTPKEGDPQAWWQWLRQLWEARQIDLGAWPAESLPLIRELVLSALRWSRATGFPCFGDDTTESIREPYLSWAKVLADPGLLTVGRWWFAGFRMGLEEPGPPPLPAHAATGRVLAMLRADWNKRGDFLGVNHPRGATRCMLEWVSLGKRWLGPEWSGVGVDPSGPVRMRTWMTGPHADCLQWMHQDACGRPVLRVAVLLRGRGTVILGQQIGGLQPGELVESRVQVAEGIVARRLPESRAVQLVGDRPLGRAHIVPLSLPDHDSSSERGSFRIERNELVLSQRAEGTRLWMPLLLTTQRRSVLEWRRLTVSRRSRIVREDVASAARFRWDRDYSLIIYKALAKPTLHSLIGHQTSAGFLLAWFNRQGEWNPFLEQE